MKIGIIGTGRMGSARAKHIVQLPGANLQWVCSRDLERAEKLITDTFEGGTGDQGSAERPLALADWREAVQRSDTDGVIITTPNAVHFEMVSDTIAAGKAILVEYPHATVPKHGEKLVKLAKKRAVPVHVGLSHKYSPTHKMLTSYTRREAETDLGRPIAYHMTTCSGNAISRWYDKDDLSGGMFISSLYHMIDEALDYFGAYRDFKASYFAERDSRNVIQSDSGSLMIRFLNGCTAHLTYARGLPKPGLGSNHTFIFENGYIVQDNGPYRLLTADGEVELKGEEKDSTLEDTRAFLRLANEPGSRNSTLADAQRTLVLAYEAQREATR